MTVFALSQYDIQWAMWKKLDRGFPIFDNNSKNLCDITNSELWSWKNLFSIISNKNKFCWTMLEERLNYLSVLCRESNITQSLLYDEAIKEYAAKKIRAKNFIELYQAVNYWKYYLFFSWGFLCLWYLSACLNL